MQFQCCYCKDRFATAVGLSLHEQRCLSKYIVSESESSGDEESPCKAPRLHNTPSVTSSRSQPDQSTSPPATANRIPLDSQAAQQWQPGSPSPCALETALAAVDPADGNDPPAATDIDCGAATRAVHLPDGRPFTVPDVQHCTPPADDDDDDEGGPEITLPPDVTRQEACLARILHCLPRARQRELLQLIHVEQLTSETVPRLQTPADLKRLLPKLDAAAAGHGQARVRGCDVHAVCRAVLHPFGMQRPRWCLTCPQRSALSCCPLCLQKWVKEIIHFNGRDYLLEFHSDPAALLKTLFANKQAPSSPLRCGFSSWSWPLVVVSA